MEKPEVVRLKIVFTSNKEVKDFSLADTLLGEILLYAARLAHQYNFSVKIFENDVFIEDAIVTTNNTEEIMNLKIFLRNYSNIKTKKLLLKNRMEFKFSLL